MYSEYIFLATCGVILPYFVGSMPIAYIFVRFLKGIDIRSIGSGNVGATNAGRAVGAWGFFAVLILDALKGYIPVALILSYCMRNGFSQNIALITAFSIIIGHTFSVFLNFKGGKGVATGLGIFLALAPVPVMIATTVFAFIVLLTRMISLGSVVSSFVLAVLVTLMSGWIELAIFTWVIDIFVTIKHRSNISRILAGNENKVKLWYKT